MATTLPRRLTKRQAVAAIRRELRGFQKDVKRGIVTQRGMRNGLESDEHPWVVYRISLVNAANIALANLDNPRRVKLDDLVASIQEANQAVGEWRICSQSCEPIIHTHKRETNGRRLYLFSTVGYSDDDRCNRFSIRTVIPRDIEEAFWASTSFKESYLEEREAFYASLSIETPKA